MRSNSKLTIDSGENTKEFRALIDAARRQSRVSDLGSASSPGTIQDETFQFRFADKPRATLPAQDAFSDHAPDPESTIHIDGESQPIAFDLDEPDDDVEAMDSQPATFVFGGPDDHDGLDDEAVDSLVDQTMAFLNATPSSQHQYLRHDPLAPRTLLEAASPQSKHSKKRQQRELQFSKHGIAYPSLPVSVVKKLATTFARASGALGPKSSLPKDALREIEIATDLFFEQVSGDIGAYAEHAGRNQIQEGDVVAVMRRQRLLDERNTTFSLAQKHLGRELVQEMRMAPVKVKKRRRRVLETVREEAEESS